MMIPITRFCSYSNSKFVVFVYAVTVAAIIVSLTTSSRRISKDLRVSPRCKDADCIEFHRLLAERWPSGKPRGVVILLIGRRTVHANATVFRNFVEHFDTNFNSEFNYPVIVFYRPKEISETDKQYLRSMSSSTIYFQEVVFRVPPFINETKLSQSEHCGGLGSFPLGYRHMCRFHALTIYDEPIMAADRLDYVLRLDDDSLFTEKVKYDVFRYMQDRRLIYGYAGTSSDFMECVVGLEDAVSEYRGLRNVTPYFPWRMPTIVYNNFELSEIAFWRSAAYRDFINYLDLKGGIYYNRWGDAPIKSFAVSLFVATKDMHVFGDIGYVHRGMARNW